ncbi:hypothetical protein [Bartonella sp. AR 15-3]|uniref:hypothetical protein n=1 Tax=Bartonella sp. AR 15-3 TaxID=545617 RepID=UPI000999E522|nr:hypothetical protein [Bartonella sp. AR 15-3]OPB31334.1 hypothetical protein BAR153v2_002760 [Bartonella sp. AR 15-3]
MLIIIFSLFFFIYNLLTSSILFATACVEEPQRKTIELPEGNFIIKTFQYKNKEKESKQNTTYTIELPEGNFVIKAFQDKDKGKKSIQNPTYTMANNAKRKKTFSNSSCNDLKNKDYGVIGIYAVGWLDAKNVTIKGPQKESNTAVKYIGVYTRENETVQNGSVEDESDENASALNASVQADKLSLQNLTIGLYASKNSSINVLEGTIKESQIAVHAEGEAATIELFDVGIEVGNNGIGLFSQKDSIIQMEGKNIDFAQGSAVRIEGGNISLEKVNINNQGQQQSMSEDSSAEAIYNAAIYMYPKSSLDMKGGNIDLNNAHGLIFDIKKSEDDKQEGKDALQTKVDIEGVSIKVNGKQFYGVYGISSATEKSTSDIVVSLKKTNFTVPEHTVIYNKANQKLIFNLSDQTKLSGDLLLEADSGTIDINANNSQLKGGALITGPATVNFDLKNNSMLSGDLLLKAAGGTINIKADSSQLKGDTIITGAATVNFDLKNNSKLSGNHLLKAAGGTIDIKADTSQLQGDTIITGAATVNFDLKNNSKLSGDFLLEVAGGTIDVKANNSQLQGDTIIIDTATVNFDLKNNSKLFGNLVLEADSGTININADNSQLKGSTLITGTATVNFDLKNNSKLSDDLLLEADSGIININADNSQLKGSTLITGPATVNFDLKNNSKLFGDLLLEQTGLSGDLLLEADSGTININADNSHLKGGLALPVQLK